MEPHILIAIDFLQDQHLQAIADAVNGWATWERIAEGTPAAVYQEKVAQSEIVVGWPEPQWLLTSSVRLFQCGSAGPDKYLGKGLDKKPNFTLCSARGVMSVAVAEHAITLMFALARQIPRHLRDREIGHFQRLPVTAYRELTGSTVCVVGLGGIGTEVARRCVGLGMQVIGVRQDVRTQHELVRQSFALNRLKQAVARADHVVVVVPGGRTTAHLINDDVLGAMKPGAWLYNLSRGSVVDERALIERLRSGHLAGAGLDVFAHEPLPADSPLWSMDNVLITPHCAGLSANISDRMCRLIVTNLINYRDGRPLLNVVPLD